MPPAPSPCHTLPACLSICYVAGHYCTGQPEAPKALPRISCCLVVLSGQRLRWCRTCTACTVLFLMDPAFALQRRPCTCTQEPFCHLLRSLVSCFVICAEAKVCGTAAAVSGVTSALRLPRCVQPMLDLVPSLLWARCCVSCGGILADGECISESGCCPVRSALLPMPVWVRRNITSR